MRMAHYAAAEMTEIADFKLFLGDLIVAKGLLI
jgi:hypothetical protein